eukprot:CAMPEP_0176165990 /NCGR_PEP_ID=MMETSP0120_2-20121206/84894_1 /TAXON_ID=160619 /ORGANISM="Kryptoperidinium foliaceum, Strain CCMP 1326" /LENGTH=256 /DNA_ID=CAMNT_0017503521 /DNA_START=49 /DNA_END=820 /DNA_ORIENTATION=-
MARVLRRVHASNVCMAQVLLAVLVGQPAAAWRVDDNALGFVFNFLGGVIESKIGGSLDGSGTEVTGDSSFSDALGNQWHDDLPEHGPGHGDGSHGMVKRLSPPLLGNRSATPTAAAASELSPRAAMGGAPAGTASPTAAAWGSEKEAPLALRLSDRRAKDFAQSSLRLRFLSWATVYMELECKDLKVACDITPSCKPVSCTKVEHGVADFSLRQASEFLKSAEEAWSSDGGRRCKIREVRNDETSCQARLFPLADD